MDIIKKLIIGMVIGISNVIPGVSGGTMAVVFGIYDKLISSVTNFFKDWKKNVQFLGTLAIGAVLGILLFTKLIKVSLETYPEQTKFFFIGLIVGTVPLLYKKATEEKVNKINYVWLVVAFSIAFLMGYLGDPEAKGTLITNLSGMNIVKIFFGGFIAAATMILPGVSGSFVLLLLGLYDSVITAVTNFNIPVLFVLGLGVLFGFLTMTKIIETLFRKYPQTAYFTILGLVVGSVYAIYPGFTFSIEGLISIITLLIGFVVAYLIGRNE
ncbi:DUF368 domain-containing protein [Clostridium paraputrificum]|uniref:DUF368 domain-containing protein n=1 Tax=Clostridium TaxID=1485 RepID=UPI003D358303